MLLSPMREGVLIYGMQNAEFRKDVFCENAKMLCGIRCILQN